MTCTSLRSGIASSGVLVSAQIPPAIPNTTRMMMRNALRALDSMMRSRRNSFLRSEGAAAEAGVGVSMCFLPWALPGFQCALHLCLRVNKEVAARDDALGFLQTGLHLVEVAVFATQFN